MRSKEKQARITNSLKQNRGITLVALVVTIVVLIILATVSINLVFSENGIISRAELSKEYQANAEASELDKMGTLTNVIDSKINGEPPTEEIEIPKPTVTVSKVVEASNGTGTEVASGSVIAGSKSLYIMIEATIEGGTVSISPAVPYAVTENGNYTFTITGTVSGKTVTEETTVTVDQFKAVETISPTETKVGYYADIEGNGIVDGVIFADLAVGGSGQWTDGDGAYTIPKVSGLKNYYVKTKGYAGKFGTKDVLSPIGEGADRFYVMALTDFDASTHYWYYSAYDTKMSDYASATKTDFEAGKANTTAMIAKWNNKSYGSQNSNDMWGLIQNKVKEGWFVPSRGEWGAFGKQLNITSSNYGKFGLSNYYWSSSQYNPNGAWYANFSSGIMFNNDVNSNFNYVRLCTTF